MKDISTFFDKTIFKSGNLLIYFFLIACFLSRFNSKIFFLDILSNLSFQILIGGIILIFILLFLKRFLAAIICIIFCAVYSFDILSTCNKCNAILKDKSQNKNIIKLMIFNISYNNPTENFENIKSLILSEKIDILQFQEVSPQMNEKIRSLKSIFPYSTGLDKPLDLFDSLILSKYPLLNTEIGQHHLVQTNFILNEKKISILGMHLFPGGTQVNLNYALQQTNYLKEAVNNINTNLILLGDLNMTSSSKRFTNFLKDTNLYTYSSFKNITSTWPTFLPNYLGIQIDHVLFSKNFRLISKKIANNFGSDHRPLIVELAY
jgi:endonuclease/exonuclease/phosphatase (EEP) superfamily protein YafD